MPLSDLHPIIRRWFGEKFGAPTDPQRLGWPEIRAGRNTLIAAPTGSGKTLTAFLSAIDSLFREGQPFGLPDETRILYVSPLKALSNDIQRNLQGPLSEIETLALREGMFTSPIRVVVRTGDTPAAARQAMLRRPPHILVTTPESLYLLLTAEKSRKILMTVTTVIVDEIHAVARDKRGSHLALSLERLDAVCGRRLQRIGLSATQKPMETIAKFLVGTARSGNGGNPDCAIVDVGHDRKLDLAIEDPPGELSAVCSNEQWDGIYRRLSELVRSHRSTLIFVNTRRFAERITHHLTELLGPEAVSSHHGSLSKKIRLDAEQRLKAGQLKAVVATGSLELGIDIGFVDLVIQIGSPRSIATFLQRVGRSGHALGLVPKGRLFALTRDELMECAALIRSVRMGLLDRIEIPVAPLDILAQQIVAEVAAGERDTEAVYDWCRGAWPYRNLERKTFDRVVAMLAEGFSSGSGRAGTYLHHDRVGGKLRARRGARLSALTSGGAIPELADYKVVAYPDQVTVGSVDEDFAIESMSGDIFLLGNTSWKILHVRGGEVAVSDAHGAPPTIPFWRGEAPGRTVELSRAVSDLREELSNRVDHPNDAAGWLKQQVPVSDSAAGQIVRYLAAQKAAAGMLPTQDHLLFERFFDESGGMQLVIHSPYGSRINRAWGLALRKSFCRTFDFELQASADDDGIVISLGPQQSFPLETIPKMVPSEKARSVLEQALLAAPMFMTRWRWNANRALAVLRSRGGKRVPPPLQRMRADDLLVKAFPEQMACRENLPQGDIPIPDHPLVFQTVTDCLNEAMDKDRWLDLLRSIEEGRVRITALDSREPSPFSYEILNANPYAFLDDAPLEERRARAVATRRTLTIESVRDIGKLDPHAINQVRREAWPVARDADELHDALSVMGMLPSGEGREWRTFFDQLSNAGRATEARGSKGPSFWIATEQWPMVRAARPDLTAEPDPRIPEGVRSDWSASEAWVALVRGRIEVAGPVTAGKLSADLGLETHHVESALGALEAQGIVLRGRFTPQDDPGAMNGAPTESHGPPHIIEWCARNLLTRIHRLTLDRLRRQIEPATVAQFFQFLFRWHHLEPGTQDHGPEAVAAGIERLQGFEIPAVAWEQSILPMRIRKYDPAWLDDLCLNGEVAWGRISPPAVDSEDPKSRIRAATKTLPVSLWIREDDPWLKWRDSEPPESVLSSNARTVFEILKMRGATFFSDLIRGAHLLPTQVEEAIWELVAAGLVTGDGFAGIRSLANPLRKQQEARIRRLRSRGRAVHAVRRGAGRWTLMTRPSETMKDEAIIEAWAHQLLHRYGILFRDLLAREEAAPPWHLLRPVLRRMEARGQVHGGRFVLNVSGEQYALPEAVESLRHIRREPPSDQVVFISAIDPLNLAGILTPGLRVNSTASNLLAFYAGNLAGYSKGGTVWVEEILPVEVKQTIRRTLETGKIL
jgi:ATP-dependent helicase Lhr and Lhr-like helicase